MQTLKPSTVRTSINQRSRRPPSHDTTKSIRASFTLPSRDVSCSSRITIFSSIFNPALRHMSATHWRRAKCTACGNFGKIKNATMVGRKWCSCSHQLCSSREQSLNNRPVLGPATVWMVSRVLVGSCCHNRTPSCVANQRVCQHVLAVTVKRGTNHALKEDSCPVHSTCVNHGARQVVIYFANLSALLDRSIVGSDSSFVVSKEGALTQHNHHTDTRMTGSLLVGSCGLHATRWQSFTSSPALLKAVLKSSQHRFSWATPQRGGRQRVPGGLYHVAAVLLGQRFRRPGRTKLLKRSDPCWTPLRETRWCQPTGPLVHRTVPVACQADGKSGNK